MPVQLEQPRISVVIPTYNAPDSLRATLHQLTRQSLPASEFEVIVADDGSQDGTARAVLAEFSDRLRTGYYFQEDLGNRVSAARNGGARLATAPVLCFLDTGALAGPDFLAEHLAEHESGPRAVIGYAHGYNPDHPPQALAEVIDTLTPEEMVARFGRNPEFLDIRHRHFEACGFDPHNRTICWNLLFTLNFSVRAEDMWAVGGFDEELTGWGGEDLELGYRLAEHGVRFTISRSAWVVETPRYHDIKTLLGEFRENIALCLRRRPDPVMEVGWALIGMNRPFFDWDVEYRNLLTWQQESAPRVTDELEAAAKRIPTGDRVAVFGAGAQIPESLGAALLFDFDRALLDQALADLSTRTGTGTNEAIHAIGLRTPLPDDSVDTVVLTSRLAGLWPRWRDDILSEAHRIGRSVLRTFG
jgi:glycosyltransferase involved in cell wall biosynthesis